MTIPGSTVVLLDVDNTLLDNDAVEADLHRPLAAQLGQERAERYWTIFEELRTELGYADYLGALQRSRAPRLRTCGVGASKPRLHGQPQYALTAGANATPAQPRPVLAVTLAEKRRLV